MCMCVHMHSRARVCRGWRTTSLRELVLHISHVGSMVKSRCLAGSTSHLPSHFAGPIFSTLTRSDLQVVVSAKVETGVLVHYWWNCEGHLFWKTIWQFLKRLNIVSVWLSSFPSRYILRGIEDTCLYKNLYTNVHSSVIHHSQCHKWLKQLGTYKWPNEVHNLPIKSMNQSWKGVKYWLVLQSLEQCASFPKEASHKPHIVSAAFSVICTARQICRNGKWICGCQRFGREKPVTADEFIPGMRKRF